MSVQQQLAELSQRYLSRSLTATQQEAPHAEADIERLDEEYGQQYAVILAAWLPKAAMPHKQDVLTPIVAGELLLAAYRRGSCDTIDCYEIATPDQHSSLHQVTITPPHYRHHPQHMVTGLVRVHEDGSSRVESINIETRYQLECISHVQYQFLSQKAFTLAVAL